MARARPILTVARDTADFPADAIRESLKDELGSGRLFDLAHMVVSDLQFCGCETWLPKEQIKGVFPRISKRPPGATVWLDRSTGRVAVKSFDPYRDYFLRALEGTETKRIRRCPICDNLFFALRLTQRACSKRCAGTLRVRAWRAHQAKYEQTRKEKPETVKRESKARRAKPRKEHRR
ncbi:MAG TPA: hypothetical protein VJW93_06890 [Candidatus Acidoferrales bacterium]|nr:hypothetical protein [Candidatus Acidoferrales bacterium]